MPSVGLGNPWGMFHELWTKRIRGWHNLLFRDQWLNDDIPLSAPGTTGLDTAAKELIPAINEMRSEQVDVWDDLLINSGIFTFLGASDPTAQSWQPGGIGSNFLVYKFQLNDEAFFSCQVPHTYEEGTDLRAHVHWTPADRGVAESGNRVGWKLDCSWANINEVFPSSTTYDMSAQCTGTDDYHEIQSASVYLPGIGKKISSIIYGRVYRSDTGADDTWIGATAALSPSLIQLDFHHLINSGGSKQEWIK